MNKNTSKIKRFLEILLSFPINFPFFLFNKCYFLSLFSGKVVPTFVSSTNTDRFHLPMTQQITYFPIQFEPFLGWKKMLLLAAVVMLCFTASNAQGWEIYFGSTGEDWGNSIIQAKNRDYLIAGYTEGFGVGNTAVYVIRTDVDGRRIWERVYDEGHISRGHSIIPTDDNAFLITGEIINVPQDFQKNVYLLKINNRGDLLWSKQFGGMENDSGWRIIPSKNDGGYLILGKTASSGNGGDDVYLIKVDDNGNEQWSNAYGTSGNDNGRGIVETTDGYLITGSAFSTASNSTDLYLLKIDFAGNKVWENLYGTSQFDEGQNIVAMDDGNFATVGISDSKAYLLKTTPNGSEVWSKTFTGTMGAEAYDLIKMPNGDLVFAGVMEIDADNSDAFLTRFDADGNEIWRKIIGRGSHFDLAQSLIQTADRGFAITGYNSLFGVIFNDVTFIKANANGDVYTNHLNGKIFIDEDEECDLDIGEEGLNEWIVTAKSATNTFFGTSDREGNYDITLDEGDYSVTVFVKNELWESCVAAYNVSFNSQYDTLTRNFSILKDTLCPLMEVDVSAPVAQNCSNIGYSVDYCNYGTEGVADPSIEIILDENLTMTGASIPFTFTPDSLYVFDLDSLGIDECGNFNFIAESSCNGVPFEAYTVNAHILPDSICLPTTGWDMSHIRVNGYCDVDSVRFAIENAGNGNMTSSLNFIVIEDHILGFEGNFQLSAGEQKDTAVLADGSTYRLIAQQAPGHPGNSYPTIAIEGCTTSGSFSTGFFTELQEDENDPFVSIDVQEAISPTDYIFMRSYPKGYLENGDNLIPANTPIQYHIYFQNSGTDTIQRLVIRDTLPESLELLSVVPGASSHPYQFETYSNGVLRFTFENLNLSPGGDTASIGFVQFKVSQKPNNPVGTEIPNSAAVFLGYDEPVQTATYTHIVDTIELLEILVTDVSGPLAPGVEVNAYPNPFTSSIVFEIKENRFNHLTLTVFDMSGRLVRQEKASGDLLQLTRDNLLVGMYTYQLEGDGLLLNTGKIIVR